MFCTPLPAELAECINNTRFLLFTFTDSAGTAREWGLHVDSKQEDPKCSVPEALTHFMESNPEGTVARIEIQTVHEGYRVTHWVQTGPK